MFILPLLPLLYVGLAVFLGWLVMRWIQRRSGPGKRFKRWSAGVATFVVVLLLPTWNIIAARLYMYYLCEKEGGATVYRSVVVPKHYFNQGGYPVVSKKFVSSPTGLVEYSCFGEACFQRSEERHTVLTLPPGSEISRYEMKYVDPSNQEILGKTVSYAHLTWYSIEGASDICPKMLGNTALVKMVFVPGSED